MTMIIPAEVGVSRVTAVFLRGHLRLVAAGMQTRGRKTDLLKKAGDITGKKYKRGEYHQAAEDISAWLKEQQA